MQAQNHLVRELSEDCQCLLCTDTMENPRSLACRHSYCKECLEKFVVFNSTSQVVIKCPYKCPNETVLRQGQTVGSGLSAELSLKKNLEILKRSVSYCKKLK